MAEPETRADHVDELFPWLLHWSIQDERIGGFRSDCFALRRPDGLVLIDALPLEPTLEEELGPVAAILLTHGNHQRSAWRRRRESGAPVYAPAGVKGLDEEPDVLFDEATSLPAGLRAIRARAFDAACYLRAEGPDGRVAAICGDLICHDPGGPYRFPVEPGYFDAALGTADAEQLIAWQPGLLCAAHAVPLVEDACEALRSAIQRA